MNLRVHGYVEGISTDNLVKMGRRVLSWVDETEQ